MFQRGEEDEVLRQVQFKWRKGLSAEQLSSIGADAQSADLDPLFDDLRARMAQALMAWLRGKEAMLLKGVKLPQRRIGIRQIFAKLRNGMHAMLDEMIADYRASLQADLREQDAAAEKFNEVLGEFGL